MKNKRLFTTSAIALALQITTSLQLMAMDGEDLQKKAGLTPKAPAAAGAGAAAAAAAVAEATTASGKGAGASMAAGLVDAGDDAIVDGVYNRAMAAYTNALTNKKAKLEAANDAAASLWESVLPIHMKFYRKFDSLNHSLSTVIPNITSSDSTLIMDDEMRVLHDSYEGLGKKIMKITGYEEHWYPLVDSAAGAVVQVADLDGRRGRAMARLEDALAKDPLLAKTLNKPLQEFRDAGRELTLAKKMVKLYQHIAALIPDAGGTVGSAVATASVLPAEAKAKK